MRMIQFAFCILHFAFCTSSVLAAPTLARLSFWVPPQRMAEFEAAYREKVVPLLKRHGLTESSERGRATPDSIFSRLFEVKTPLEVGEKWKALQGDSTWSAMLRDLGATFGTPQTDSLVRNEFLLYATPAGPGKIVPAGPGKTVPAGEGRGHWRTYDMTDGLAGISVRTIIQDREGNLWFGTGSGVSRYDGRTFTTFTAKDGLANNVVGSIFQDREGYIWFGTWDGVSRYDGRTFTTFTTKDGLANNGVGSIFQDREGVFWFGTSGGVSRYDGQCFTTFTTQDGLADNRVHSIIQDREGVFWFVTSGGVSRYDGQRFATFTTQDGLAHNIVRSVCQDREGVFWFGTWGGGVSRYDGKSFITFTTQDGLAHNEVRSIFQDRKGYFWFITNGGGVSRYDGQVFQTMIQQDGLAHNVAISTLQDRGGALWFGTANGVTRYRPPASVPLPAFIDAVVTDKRYEKLSHVTIPSGIGLTVFEFHGMSFKTRPEAMVYRYRLQGYDKDWKNTHARRVEYHDLPRGIYTFEVQAVDRDLVYSEKPATVTLRVHLPYERIGWMSALGIAVAVIFWQAGRIVYRDRRLAAANRALEEANVRLQRADAVKTDFFSNVSHELRTPMTAIKGYVDNLLDGIAGEMNERQARYLTRVRSNADRLTRLINDLLDLSRIDRGQADLLHLNIQRASVKEAVAEAVEGLRPVAESAGLALRVEGEDAVALADRDRLVQIVTNLVGNAIKFTPRGGQVSVTVGVQPSPRQATPATPLPHVGEEGGGSRPHGSDRWSGPSGARRGEGLTQDSRLRTQDLSGDGFVVVSVRDTGRGIPAKDLEKVFDRFYQVKGEGGLQPGTGLGLPIAKELVELMGGTIHMESEVGKGSAFWFTLPEAKDAKG